MFYMSKQEEHAPVVYLKIYWLDLLDMFIQDGVYPFPSGPMSRSGPGFMFMTSCPYFLIFNSYLGRKLYMIDTFSLHQDVHN